MSDEWNDPGWPPEAGDPTDLPRELEPPEALEDRVVRSLHQRELLASGDRRAGFRRATLVSGLAAAALLFLAGGFLLGRASLPGRAAGASAAPVPGEEPARYALLLYETTAYDRAEGPELLDRYREYSRWVAEARSRDQFVTGEDLAVERGWTLNPPGEPSARQPSTESGVRAPHASVLSGMFVISAQTEADALALAGQLPHLRHGGHVVVQKVVPTDSPPAGAPSTGSSSSPAGG